ncbi:hypothetical protein GCM10012287_30920 [Streptomyces daqingensis]|uniref:Uncharacterized protein n=1 Tax=Streptomyces daqingensis TaxID=1472640 RepID=A0ABQ2MFN0_9ACTN|nr:hypothetical protein GCM10012287_30920 [Streptomyces daqingensis]
MPAILGRGYAALPGPSCPDGAARSVRHLSTSPSRPAVRRSASPCGAAPGPSRLSGGFSAAVVRPGELRDSPRVSGSARDGVSGNGDGADVPVPGDGLPGDVRGFTGGRAPATLPARMIRNWRPSQFPHAGCLIGEGTRFPSA